MTKVLIVEDDPILNRAYVTVLTMEGFEVDSATDGYEGIKKAEASSPDIILLDMLMPNMDGLSFLRAFKQKENHPNTKIIVFSNMSVPESMQEAVSLGAAKYLTKSSFTPKEMVEVIKETLSQPSPEAAKTAENLAQAEPNATAAPGAAAGGPEASEPPPAS